MGRHPSERIEKISIDGREYRTIVKSSKDAKKYGEIYTPEYIVDFILSQTLEPCLSDILNSVNRYNGALDQLVIKIEEKVKDISICDPACGTGIFLIKSLHMLEGFYQDLMSLLDAEAAEYKILNPEDRKSARQYSTRKISLMHLYGVDINELSVSTCRSNLLGMDIGKTLDSNHSPGINFIAGNALICREPGKRIIGKETGIFKTPRQLNLLLSTRNSLKAILQESDNLSEDKCSVLMKQMQSLREDVQDSLKEISDLRTLSETPLIWEVNFPEVFASKIHRGFSFVIGNPPYVQLSMDSKRKRQWRDYLIGRYGSSMGRLNTFGFFIILGIELIKVGGTMAFIVPNTLLTQDYYRDLRHYILDHCAIESICVLQSLPFNEPIVENIVIVLRKCLAGRKRRINQLKVFDMNQLLVRGRSNQSLKHEYSEHRDSFIVRQIPQSAFYLEPNFRFNIHLDSELLKVGPRFQGLPYRLRDLCFINQGIAIRGDRSKVLGDKIRNSGDYYPILDGRDLHRYFIDEKVGSDERYLHYKPETIHSGKSTDKFLTESKVFFRRTGTKIIAAVDKRQRFALNTLVVVNIKPNNPLNLDVKEIYLILGFLNSHMINWYFTSFLKSIKTTFSEIQARKVAQIPIPEIPAEKRKDLNEINAHLSICFEILNKLHTKLIEMLPEALKYLNWQEIQTLTQTQGTIDAEGFKLNIIEMVGDKITGTIENYAIQNNDETLLLSAKTKELQRDQLLIKISFDDIASLSLILLYFFGRSLKKRYRKPRNLFETFLTEDELSIPEVFFLRNNLYPSIKAVYSDIFPPLAAEFNDVHNSVFEKLKALEIYELFNVVGSLRDKNERLISDLYKIKIWENGSPE